MAKIAELARRLLNPRFWRGRAQIVGYTAFGLVLFLIFLMSNFPYGQTLSAMLTPFNLSFSYRTQRSSLPLGAELDGVRLSDALMPGAAPILNNVNLRLTPMLGSLLLARPGIRINADLYGGYIIASLYRSSGLTGVSFNASGLNLGRYDALVKMGVNARGRLSGRGTAELAGTNLSGASGNCEITVKDFFVRFARGLPPVRIGELNGSASFAHGVLRVEHLTGKGGDLSLDATGTIRLAPDLPDSLLNLRVNLHPTAIGRKHLGFLLAMLPYPPGTRPYLLRGRLAAPSIR